MARRYHFKNWSLAVGAMLVVLATKNLNWAQHSYDGNMAERMLDLHTVDLKVQLKNGLRAVFPEQQQFLDIVIAAVENKQISRAMVNVIYVWSLEKNPKVPFPYFQIALRTLAARRGVTL